MPVHLEQQTHHIYGYPRHIEPHKLGLSRTLMSVNDCQQALHGTTNTASILPDNKSHLQTRRGRLLYTHSLGFSQHVCGLCQPLPLLLAVFAPQGCLLGPCWGEVHKHVLRLRHRRRGEGRGRGRDGACPSVWKHLALCSVRLLLAQGAFWLSGVQCSCRGTLVRWLGSCIAHKACQPAATAGKLDQADQLPVYSPKMKGEAAGL